MKKEQVQYLFLCLFVCSFEALCPGQQLFSHFETVSWVYPELSNGDKVTCSWTQHRAPGEDRRYSMKQAAS